MEKLVLDNKIVLKGYNDLFNALPSEGFHRIKKEEFYKYFFAISWDFFDSKQLYYDPNKKSQDLFRVRLFIKETSETIGAIGLAVMDNWKRNEINYGMFGNFDLYNKYVDEIFKDD